jgi:hypothetical protein
MGSTFEITKRAQEMTREEIAAIIESSDLNLKPSQSRLSVPIIARICKKMKAGLVFPDIKIDDDVICDGHHRYIASLLAGVDIETTISLLTSDMRDWQSVIFDDNDWDTEEEILRWNEMDAHYNDIPLERVLEILK